MTEFRLRYDVNIRVGQTSSTFLTPRFSETCACCGQKPKTWAMHDGLFWCPLCGQAHRGPEVGKHGEPRFNDSRPDERHVWLEANARTAEFYKGNERLIEIECGMHHGMVQLVVYSKEGPVTYRCDSCQRELEDGWRTQELGAKGLEVLVR